MDPFKDLPDQKGRLVRIEFPISSTCDFDSLTFRFRVSVLVFGVAVFLLLTSGCIQRRVRRWHWRVLNTSLTHGIIFSDLCDLH